MYSRKYSTLIENLSDFLNPHAISTHPCDIFEETLLKAAGVETQPTKCRFASENKDKMHFKIRGINEEEAAKFLNFLKETTGDVNATMKFVPPLADDELGFPEELYDVHHFIVDQDMVNEKLFALFKENYSSISKEKIAEYTEKSKNDRRVTNYQANLVRKKTNMLVDGLHKFLAPELISVYSCDIFEETLLTLAGVETQPKKCHFDVVNANRSGFTIEGISNNDAETFITFFKEILGDDSAYFSMLQEQKEGEDKVKEKHYFDVNLDKLIEKGLLLFKDGYTQISKDKLDSYRKLCENDYMISNYIYQKTAVAWQAISDSLEKMLNPLLISCRPCDVFEETILKFAGIETQPEKCQFGPDLKKGKFYFRIKGISEEESNRFLAYFKDTLGDASATSSLAEKPRQGHPEQLIGVQEFLVNMDIVANKLLPQFKVEIENLERNLPEKFASYQKASENEEGVENYKLAQIFDEIIMLSTEVQSLTVSDYVRGQFDIILKFMLDKSIKAYEAQRKDVHSPMPMIIGTEVSSASMMFKKVSENEEIKDNEKVKELNENLKLYTGAKSHQSIRSMFGMFGGFNSQDSEDDDLENDATLRLVM